MRDLHTKKQRQTPHNRVKKAPKKRKPVNWRPILTWGARAIGAAALCAALGLGSLRAYRAISRTTLLRLETIDVSPTRRVTRDEVITMAGVKPGDSMLGLKLKGVVDQLSKNPWIEQVQ